MLIIYGLIFDAVGVVILALALVATPDRYLWHQSRTVVGGSHYEFQSLLTQKFDAWFGITIMVLGFVLQLLGQMNVSMGSSDRLSLLLLAIILAIFFYKRRGMAEKAQRLNRSFKDELL